MWLGIYLLYLMNFLFEHAPWPVTSLRETSVFLEVQTSLVHFYQTKSARRQNTYSPGEMELVPLLEIWNMDWDDMKSAKLNQSAFHRILVVH